MAEQTNVVYAIIVTYNGSHWVEKCFSSLRSSTIPLSIIVVDNGSTDGTQKKIKDQYPEVELIQAKENLGFGKANNIGIKKAHQAGSDYVFLLNQDAWIEKETIEKLIQIAQKNNKFGVISPIHLNGNGTALDLNFSYYISPQSCPNLISDLFIKKLEDKIYPVEFVNAAAWLLTRKCVETVGGFDSAFYHYGEDNNYLHRANFHGLEVGIYPNTLIFHDRGELNKSSNKYFRELEAFKRKKLIEYCNPKNKRNISEEKRLLTRSIIKALLLLNFKAYRDYKSKYSILREITSKVNYSHNINSQGGLNYL